MRRIHAGISLSCKLASLFLSLYLFFSLLFTLDLYSFRSLRPFLFLSFFLFFSDENGSLERNDPFTFLIRRDFSAMAQVCSGGWLVGHKKAGRLRNHEVPPARATWSGFGNRLLLISVSLSTLFLPSLLSLASRFDVGRIFAKLR